MSIRIPTINCQWCGDRIPENKVNIRKIKVAGVTRKQIVHSADHCIQLGSSLHNESRKKENCYRRHQDFKKRIQLAQSSDNPELRKFARKCLWNMIERKPTKYLNLQLKAISAPPGEQVIFKKFRWFCLKPMVVMVQ